MTYAGMPVRLATAVAERDHDSAWWDGPCPGGAEEHRATRNGEPRPISGTHPHEVRRGWDGGCAACGEPIPWDGEAFISGGSGTHLVYDTPSGKLEPGCMLFVDQHPDHGCCAGWTNCDGQHLHVVLPNGHHWDIDSRASNCGSPADTEHRCWVRHGEPPQIHVDKTGRTCSAGAGSIAVGDYHGFLHHGQLTAG